MQFTAKKKAAAVLGAGAIAVAASGVAYAFYNVSESGTQTGSASVDSSTLGAVTPTAASAVTGLVLNGSPVDSTVTLTNPNAFAVHIPGGAVAVTGLSGGPVGCATLAASGIGGTATVAAQTIAANDHVDITVPVTMSETGTNQTPCNGQSFTLTYTLS